MENPVHLFTITEKNDLFCVESVEVVKETLKQYYVRLARPAFGDRIAIPKKEPLVFTTESDAIEGYRWKVLLQRIVDAEASLVAFDKRFGVL